MADIFMQVAGLDNPTGVAYLFWSGIGANLSVLGGIAVLYRKLNCHEPHCLRIGHHHLGEFVLCKKHYDHRRPTSKR